MDPSELFRMDQGVVDRQHWENQTTSLSSPSLILPILFDRGYLDGDISGSCLWQSSWSWSASFNLSLGHAWWWSQLLPSVPLEAAGATHLFPSFSSTFFSCFRGLLYQLQASSRSLFMIIFLRFSGHSRHLHHDLWWIQTSSPPPSLNALVLLSISCSELFFFSSSGFGWIDLPGASSPVIEPSPSKHPFHVSANASWWCSQGASFHIHCIQPSSFPFYCFLWASSFWNLDSVNWWTLLPHPHPRELLLSFLL